jgi:hypothetical protein
MKKIVLSIVGAAVIGIAAMNVNLAVTNDLIANVTLENIMSLATGESGTCSVCGNSFDGCTCGASITCSTGSCHGKVCHHDTGNYFCPCVANGDAYTYCLL